MVVQPSDCYYAVWGGFGALATPPDGVATLLSTAPCCCCAGPLSDTATVGVSMTTAPFEQSPSLWWPADQARCVATDIDLNSSYIGADNDCIKRHPRRPLSRNLAGKPDRPHRRREQHPQPHAAPPAGHGDAR